MKKLINSVETVLTESLQGFAAAHADIVALDGDCRFVRRARPVPGKVALISGGGSGHEPLHAGFVGRGMLDAACPGQIFTSPTPDQMVAAAAAVDGGAGLLLIVKNYEGDVMNFEMAAEMIGGPVMTVLTDDDVAGRGLLLPDRAARRRRHPGGGEDRRRRGRRGARSRRAEGAGRPGQSRGPARWAWR